MFFSSTASEGRRSQLIPPDVENEKDEEDQNVSYTSRIIAVFCFLGVSMIVTALVFRLIQEFKPPPGALAAAATEGISQESQASHIAFQNTATPSPCLDADVGDSTRCGDRINFLIKNEGFSSLDAGNRVAFDYPACGKCSDIVECEKTPCPEGAYYHCYHNAESVLESCRSVQDGPFLLSECESKQCLANYTKPACPADTNTNCGIWANTGLCEEEIILKKCPTSCGCGPVCEEDTNMNCGMWASTGLCEVESVQNKCQTSCGCEADVVEVVVEKPACAKAEAQSPRDLSSGAAGKRAAKAAVLTEAEGEQLFYADVRFHLGAEHKSDEYSNSDASDSFDRDHRRLRRLVDSAGSREVRPGFMCPVSELSKAQLKPYSWQFCKGEVRVGNTYEVQYVSSSSSGATDLNDFNQDQDQDQDQKKGQDQNQKKQDQDKDQDQSGANPMVVVKAQVFLIINDDADEYYDEDLIHAWQHTRHKDAVMYSGSTTGTSYDNSVCSPYTVTWHVDRQCHKISARSFDKMCKDMSDNFGVEENLYPHGARVLASEAWVVPAREVYPLA